WVGVSVSITSDSIDDIASLCRVASRKRVRYLRFLFAEPTGRGARPAYSFARGDVRRRALEVLRQIADSCSQARLEHLSVNNPFDLSDEGSGVQSCLLAT